MIGSWPSNILCVGDVTFLASFRSTNKFIMVPVLLVIP